MTQLSIEICNNRAEALARKKIIMSANPEARWVSRIIENIDFISSFLVPDLSNDPVPQLPPVFSSATHAPRAPCVVLLIWVGD